MVYISMILAKANEVFAPTMNFNPNDLLALLEGADTIGEAAERLGYEDVIEDPQWQQVFQEFLVSIPPSVDAAAMAAARSALERELRVTLTWGPAYAFGLKVWEVSKDDPDGWVGMVNIEIASRDPEWEHRAG
jgi:hypothetical protein